MTLRVAILPPAPAAYREPLFEALAARPELELSVIYQSVAPASWDGAPGFHPTEHAYPAVHLGSRQRARPGRSPIVWPVGLEGALSAADPDCVIAVEYGAASLRALACAAPATARSSCSATARPRSMRCSPPSSCGCTGCSPATPTR